MLRRCLLTSVGKSLTGRQYRFFSGASLSLLDSSINAKLRPNDYLLDRHIGPSEKEIQDMLKTVGASSVQELIQQTIPKFLIDANSCEGVGEPIPEQQMLIKMRQLAAKNKLYKTYIGCGFYDTIMPPVIQRNLFENPGWYTAYTPYQAEISQGRLESLLNFQTMIQELTGMEVANASLLDEASAAAECVTLAHSTHNGKRNTFFVSKNAFPQTISVIKSRAYFLGVDVIVEDERTFDFSANSDKICGVLVQTPDTVGLLRDYKPLFAQLEKLKIVRVIATDLLALCVAKTPADMGADIALGSSQRFGVPLGYGGPSAAFLSCVDKFKRRLPGRIIGITKDDRGNQCYRMALQTREQHIKREKATSNICTAQALLANIAAMYAVYHGPKGLRAIAERTNSLAQVLAGFLASSDLGYEVTGYDTRTRACSFFDTVTIKENADKIATFFEQNEVNVRKIDANTVSVSFDETTTIEDVAQLAALFAQYKGRTGRVLQKSELESHIYPIEASVKRQSQNYLQQPVFNSYHSETNMMRYLNFLERRDIALNRSMIPLGSCTLKLNAASQMMPLSWPGWSRIHPFVPRDQAQGYAQMLSELTEQLKAITKFDDFSLQPNSGATGEYAGLLAIKRYHQNRSQGHRNICLVPTSAHGTNPASAILAGFEVIYVKTDEVKGKIDLVDLREKATKYTNNLAAFMVTYPSTFGIYEETIKEAIDIVHQNGGQVYMDGANMNAQVGFTSPAFIGADVCHLNLHKTFAIPHGGGGPGMGPIGVKKHLAPFLPSHNAIEIGGDSRVQVASAPFSSASILNISYSYISQLGREGLRRSTEIAILNANYLMKRLEGSYQVVYKGTEGRCGHEFIIDIRPFKHLQIQAKDVVKRLQDFSLHAPTVSFPIADTLMIEPTESEDKNELDRLADALLKIRAEIAKIDSGEWPQNDNPLKNAPHTEPMIITEEWKHPYSRDEAAFPLEWVRKRGKYWPPAGRGDETYGDRNFCGTITGCTF